ncbi:MAG: hypothetical protein ACSHXF_07780 [Aquaticitalea sp.]
MQLYKSRDFGEFFQDTFSFIKANGKHFFKQYLIINGVFLMIMMVMMYIFTKFYTSVIFGGIIENNPTMIDNYMNENIGLFIVMAFIFMVVALIAGVISFSFTPLYLNLFIKYNGKNFGTSEVFNAYKSNLGKIFIFLVCGFLLAIPLLLVMGIGMFVLAITIIGLLLVPVLIGTFSLLYNMTLMEYLEDRNGIWDSFSYAWTLMSSKFWPAVGSVGLFFLISYVIQGVFSMIPYIFGMASLFTTIDTANPDASAISSSITIVMLAIFFMSFFTGAIMSVIVQLNQGIVFYSLKEDIENVNTKSVIDQIGSGE